MKKGEIDGASRGVQTAGQKKFVAYPRRKAGRMPSATVRDRRRNNEKNIEDILNCNVCDRIIGRDHKIERLDKDFGRAGGKIPYHVSSRDF